MLVSGKVRKHNGKYIIQQPTAPTFDEYIWDLAPMFDLYPTENERELRHVRKALSLIDELEKEADQLSKVPRSKMRERPMTEERIDTTVFRGVFRGHELIIREMGLSKGITAIAPHLHDYYCGYVELLPEDYYFYRPSEAEDELEVYGGITYTEDYGHLYALPKGKRFVGFDTAHAFQPYFTLDTVKQDCFNLIEQIHEKNGEMK